jgi:hypothetical protein
MSCVNIQFPISFSFYNFYYLNVSIRFGKDMEGRVMAEFKVLSQYFPGGTEEKHWKLQSG